MRSTYFQIAIFGALMWLPACSFSDSDFWPSFEDEEPATTVSSSVEDGTTPPSRSPDPEVVATAQPRLGTTNFIPGGVTPGQQTGTFVGAKVADLREELQRLQSSIGQQNDELQRLRSSLVNESQQYHGTIAAVNARLQVGTTPGNPILVQQFQSAQQELDRLSKDIDRMNLLAAAISNNSTLSSYMSESARAAFSVSGAVDEDHRQLAILEDETNRTAVLIDRLLKETTEDIRRQTTYISTERANLNLLSAGIKTGEMFGGSLVNKAVLGAGLNQIASAGAPMNTVGKRPLVVVRFDRPDVPYQQALYATVSKVLEQRPRAMFDLVAVAPTIGGQGQITQNNRKARRHAEDILRSLTEMGLPPSRVAVSAKTEAQIKSNEVHLYLR